MLLPAATEDLVGRPGWLWLHRPDGWEAELAELVDESVRSQVDEAHEREERSARRRLESVQSALDHARRRASKAEAENVRLRSELAAARKELAQLSRRPPAAGGPAVPAAVRANAPNTASPANPPSRSPKARKSSPPARDRVSV